MDRGIPAWLFCSALLCFWFPFRNWLINCSLALFSLLGFQFLKLLFPNSIGKVAVMEGVVLVSFDDDLFEISFSEVPLPNRVPSKFFQKASATFCAVLFCCCATFADSFVDRVWSVG